MQELHHATSLQIFSLYCYQKYTVVQKAKTNIFGHIFSRLQRRFVAGENTEVTGIVVVFFQLFETAVLLLPHLFLALTQETNLAI